MLDLVAGHPAAERVLAQGARALGTDVRTWLAEPERLDTNSIAQPLLCLTELATWAALCDRVATPCAFAGYSVGELASYGCAGALDAGELARLAQLRAALMDAASVRPSGLIALSGLRRTEVENLCAGRSAWIAIANGDDALIVGGESATLRALADEAGARGARITCLKVGVASHTPLLAAAVAPFGAALDEATLRVPGVPVVAGVDASWVISRANAIATLAAQIAAPVEWARCLETLYERGCRVFLELGPGSALARMVREHRGPDVIARSVSEFRSLDGVVRWLERHSDTG
jgi:[acyl-carrier-protein] S-malonyltransferase